MRRRAERAGRTRNSSPCSSMNTVSPFDNPMLLRNAAGTMIRPPSTTLPFTAVIPKIPGIVLRIELKPKQLFCTRGALVHLRCREPGYPGPNALTENDRQSGQKQDPCPSLL